MSIAGSDNGGDGIGDDRDPVADDRPRPRDVADRDPRDFGWRRFRRGGRSPFAVALEDAERSGADRPEPQQADPHRFHRVFDSGSAPGILIRDQHSRRRSDQLREVRGEFGDGAFGDARDEPAADRRRMMPLIWASACRLDARRAVDGFRVRHDSSLAHRPGRAVRRPGRAASRYGLHRRVIPP